MDATLSLDRIYEVIDDPRTSVVSFDIFGTILSWPAIHPKDIVRLAARRIERVYQIRVEQERLNAPSEMEQPCASLEEIWAHVVEAHGVGTVSADALASLEAETEANLCLDRAAAKLIYAHAVASGKRIIAVSDMFLTAERLNAMLQKHGYAEISHIYVSCECGAVKRDGGLFEAVLRAEGLAEPATLVHIGDNARLDVCAARDKGMRALLLPSEADLFAALLNSEGQLPELGRSVYASVIMGYARHCAVDDACLARRSFCLKDYARSIAFPILAHATLYMLQSRPIQQGEYPCIFFLSRDGYLFYKAYKILRDCRFGEALEAQYLPASRLACRCLAEQSYEDSLRARWIPQTCTLARFLNRVYADEGLGRRICEALPSKEGLARVKEAEETSRRALAPHAEALNAAHAAKRARALCYYRSRLNGARKALLMDCGFCGTIAAYLYRGFEGQVRFDKVFLWQTDKNIMLDDILGSRTYTAFAEKKGHGTAALMEATFSEPSGSISAFERGEASSVRPVRDEFTCSRAMEQDLSLIQTEALEALRRFASILGDHLYELRQAGLPEVMDLIPLCINESTSALFDNIRFDDVFGELEQQMSLGEYLRARSVGSHE